MQGRISTVQVKNVFSNFFNPYLELGLKVRPILVNDITNNIP